MNEPRITWMQWRGQWVLKSPARLEPLQDVTVTKRNGDKETVRAGEYEHRFTDKVGDTWHLYTVAP